jgi:hypothetical protein
MLAVVACLALVSCASHGVQVSDEQAQGFQIGKATYDDVVAALGPPTHVSTSKTGTIVTKVAIYSYGAAQAHPQNFIPIIGPLVSVHDTQASAVIFVFDANGVLTRTTSGKGSGNVGFGLAAQRS